MKRFAFGITTAALLATGSANAVVYINEIHYDNDGADTGEFIEIVTTAGEDASKITVSLYNGADSELYGSNDTFVLGTDFVDHGILGDGNRYYSISLPSNGLQNGAPDGLSVDFDGTVLEFLSYEGTIASAGDGPALGLASTDIGVFQPGNTPVGSSLQRIAFGSTWELTEGTNTQGAVNIPEPGSLALLGLGGLLIARRRRG